MPICHRILLGKLAQHITSGGDKAVISDAFSTMTSSTNETSSWKTENSSLAALNQLVNVTFHNAIPWLNLTINGTGDGSGHSAKVSAVNQNSVFIKIVLLLILTAVVLLSTYKFVVRLFSGYSEKKDDSSEYYIGIQDDS